MSLALPGPRAILRPALRPPAYHETSRGVTHRPKPDSAAVIPASNYSSDPTRTSGPHAILAPPYATNRVCARKHLTGITRPIDRGATTPVRDGTGRTILGPDASAPTTRPSCYPGPAGPILHYPTDQQVGRAHPSHPAALRPGMQMGSDSPGQLSSTTRNSGRGRKFE